MMAKEWTGERLETFVFNEVTIEHLHRYALAMEFVKDKIVLDIACGEGYGANLLAKEAISVVGVDIDPETITQAQKKYAKNNLVFKQGRVENIPSTDHFFDVVISFETLEHTDEHQKFMVEIKRVLKPGGLLIVSTPEKKAYAELLGSFKNPFHKKELFQHEFEDLLGEYFKHRQLLSQDLLLTSFISSGTSHQLQFFDGDFTEIRKIHQVPPLYLVAFCSDGLIPTLPSSYFNGKWILNVMLTERENAVKRTPTYKVGHFLLSPLKWLYRLTGRTKAEKHA